MIKAIYKLYTIKELEKMLKEEEKILSRLSGHSNIVSKLNIQKKIDAIESVIITKKSEQ